MGTRVSRATPPPSTGLYARFDDKRRAIDAAVPSHTKPRARAFERGTPLQPRVTPSVVCMFAWLAPCRVGGAGRAGDGLSAHAPRA